MKEEVKGFFLLQFVSAQTISPFSTSNDRCTVQRTTTWKTETRRVKRREMDGILARSKSFAKSPPRDGRVPHLREVWFHLAVPPAEAPGNSFVLFWPLQVQSHALKARC